MLRWPGSAGRRFRVSTFALFSNCTLGTNAVRALLCCAHTVLTLSLCCACAVLMMCSRCACAVLVLCLCCAHVVLVLCCSRLDSSLFVFGQRGPTKHDAVHVSPSVRFVGGWSAGAPAAARPDLPARPDGFFARRGAPRLHPGHRTIFHRDGDRAVHLQHDRRGTPCF